ncbi:hypothetical protein BDZ91DRAFT_800943 [Kalaharituber pfeilii]|nr:hypothetical protein BDZ91DRAFT_800943 [Kalaharituber pfeilii]
MPKFTAKEFERAIGNLDAATNRVLWLSGDEEMVGIAIQLFQLGKLGRNFLLTARYRATHFQTRVQWLENKYGDMVRDFHGQDKMDCDPDILNTEDTMWFEAYDKHNQGCRIAGEDRRTQEYIAALETLLDISNNLRKDLGNVQRWLQASNKDVGKITGIRWLRKKTILLEEGKKTSSVVVYLETPTEIGKVRLGGRWLKTNVYETDRGRK